MDWWAVEFWLVPAFHEEDTLRAGLLALIASAETSDDLAMVGAGPLEAFVCDDESRVRWLEREMETSPKLKAALSNTYCWGHLSDAVCARLERAAEARLPRPPWPHRGSLPPDGE